jgi:hypothetical protein
MSSKVGTTEASQLTRTRAQLLEDMGRAEKEGDYRWYKTCEREVKRIEHKLAELRQWAEGLG